MGLVVTVLNGLCMKKHRERLGAMPIDDELLDKLGVYFVYHDVHARYGITFESFVDRWRKGILEL